MLTLTILKYQYDFFDALLNVDLLQIFFRNQANHKGNYVHQCAFFYDEPIYFWWYNDTDSQANRKLVAFPLKFS